MQAISSTQNELAIIGNPVGNKMMSWRIIIVGSDQPSSRNGVSYIHNFIVIYIYIERE